MPESWYIVAVLGVMFMITFALRAVPFAVIGPLRESVFVATLAMWMPVGILGFFALSTLHNSALTATGAYVWEAAVAAAVTIITHLAFGRRTLVSVGLGTLTFVALVNVF
ncbi:AzlD domain-containing protein [Rhodococcus artemisiae]|uniref:AzlD domain-containing protein n=1 Tax=Rhodococcus artemisiae TaxID=714159 RepID=A0ABU7LAE4_9NOCA|nr:AzlD domain-containing protein [Rhodococcus artemisiae]MEE2058489.1 AzlD domain-containing protein [Rhodococcus artemisiae]